MDSTCSGSAISSPPPSADNTILKPFMLAQELLEGEKYVTLSLVVSIDHRENQEKSKGRITKHGTQRVCNQYVESTVTGFHCSMGVGR